MGGENLDVRMCSGRDGVPSALGSEGCVGLVFFARWGRGAECGSCQRERSALLPECGAAWERGGEKKRV